MEDLPFPEENLDPILFYYEIEDFSLSNEELIANWVTQVFKSRNKKFSSISFIFCSDEQLHKINVDYLNHDTLTDIITFPIVDDPLESDIFISIERVRENAKELKLTFEEELHRVIIHGVLHLTGLGDKTPEDAQNMRTAEDEALKLLA